MDNRHLSPSDLTLLRRKAVESIRFHGLSIEKAKRVFGFSRVSLWRYLKEYDSFGEKSFEYKKRGVKLRSRSKMSVQQEEELITAVLSSTPDQLGMEHTLWNSKALQAYIESTYSLFYNRRSVRKILSRLGFTSQKPIRLAYERDPQKIEAWIQETYPKIKTRAMKEGARLYWGDEMGIHASDHRGSTYGLKGKTPVIGKTGARFKCNMLAAISPQGFMNWMVFEENFTSHKFILFLGRLIRQINQTIFLIVDNHRVHHSKKVQSYVEKHKEKIQLFFLPPYCPDLNPQELVNQDVKANANNFKTVNSLHHLTINVRYYLTKIQHDEWKIRSFFKKDSVAYAN